MQAFRFTLRALAAVIVVVSLLHAVLGLGADALLGVAVPGAAITNASLDSQNRFYGMAFALFAAVLVLAASDLERHAPTLNAALVIIFLAGLVRVLSVASHGWPVPAVVALGFVELVAPPLLYWWSGRLGRKSGA